jgi:AcrR family transcriptional regulator
MDDIAGEMCISKKTIYKYFANKELLIEESVQVIHTINNIIIVTSQDFNAIEENFEIRRMFENMFKSTDTSPVYQLKKHYPEVYQKYYPISRNVQTVLGKNIEKGIAQGLYRDNLNVDAYVKFYMLIFDQRKY